MNLIESMMEDCQLYDQASVSDGAGGFISEWREGAIFRAAITMDTTLEAEMAKKNGVNSVYTVTTKRNVRLPYHTVFKRLSDGRIFRTTSDEGDKVSPAVSTLDIAQVKAEKWELTT